jgi:hypothetical protein
VTVPTDNRKLAAIISCGRDYAALVKTLDRQIPKNIEILCLLSGGAPKRYEMTLHMAQVLRTAEASGVKFFYDSHTPETLAKIESHLQTIGADIWFFLNAGDTFCELYPFYLECFFRANHEKGGVVYAPVLTDGVDADLVLNDPRLPE